MTIYEKFLNSLATAVAAERERHPDVIGLADFFEEYSVTAVRLRAKDSRNYPFKAEL
jgi:hypothetical protein